MKRLAGWQSHLDEGRKSVQLTLPAKPSRCSDGSLYIVAGGVIQGDIRMNGHPKVQATFARVSGYVEQFDVHSPQTTVREALLFSAQLRTQGETTEVITAFVDEVMDLVELTPLRDGLVSSCITP